MILQLDTSVVPPLIYAAMGTSREIAIGPVAVVSLLLPSMIQQLQDPVADPISYTKLVLTATFFAGIFQAAFGILRWVFDLLLISLDLKYIWRSWLTSCFFPFQIYRLGFLVDFLSHAAIVGFVAGAAIVIGLQQLKGLLGISHFTTKTDIISVLESVWRAIHHHVYSFFYFFFFSFMGKEVESGRV
jgi:low affinity sulfate transporter 2